MSTLPAEDPDLSADGLDAEAVIIPESEHPLRLQDIEQEALKVLYRLRDAGFSGYLVGGGVRDLYLGKRPKDFDISTNARPVQLRKLFRNSRTIGRRFRLVQVFYRGNKIIEVSTLRCRSEYDINDPDTVLPSNNTFGTLQEDAFRRDLTINSLFYEIENKTIIDYVGGVQDLDEGIIRIVGEPGRRITRDPVRILRAIRHAARNDFAIEPATWGAIVKHRNKLDLCPPSRIRDELLKDLHTGNSRAWAEIALKTRVFFTLFPFYGEILSGRDGSRVQEELLSMLSVLDRLYGADVQKGKVVITDHMLFAVLLFPWANRQFDLFRQELKGPGYHRLAKAIRAELDDVFSHRLNLKRMAKDAITTLFVNMPGFQKNQRNNSWPAWMRRKSYFADCSRFYALYCEACGGDQVDVGLFVDAKAESTAPVRVQDRRSGGGGRGGRRGTNPAFTTRREGVFGLRKG
ncbi:MAG TPA: polya polymerase [Desulfobulbaceae bacterium]|nr:polya polymerase [Desulfobulbaceae bacterium]